VCTAPDRRLIAAEDAGIEVLVGGEHRFVFEKDGWDKSDLQDYLYEHARPTLGDLKRAGINPEPLEDGDDEQYVDHIHDPDSIFVLTAGGEAGPHSCVLTGWAGTESSSAVTVGIPGYARPATCEIDLETVE
jgi:hypothetical protein